MGRADVYLQPAAADPVLKDDLVLELTRRHIPGAAQVTEVDESGGEARAYLVDDAVVVKTQRPHRLRPRTSLAKEAHLLELLAPTLTDRIPRLLGYDRVDTDQGAVEYICMTRIPGRATRQVKVSGDARGAVLREVGAVLRTIHAAPVDASQMPVDLDAVAVQRRLEHGFGDIADAAARHDARTVTLPAPLDEVIQRAIAGLPETLTHPPVVLHSNPSPTHVFVEPSSGAFSGVIDFGDSYASHPAFDLHRWPDPADRVMLRDAYLDGAAASAEFNRMWTIAMIYTDLALIASDSAHAVNAASDLAIRLADL